MEQQYLDILEESLKKKSDILEDIKRINEEQRVCLQSDEVEFEKLDEYISQKAVYIEKLELLDQGFETIYQQVAEEIQDRREQYADKIKSMQALIRDITDKSATIQAQETRNRDLINDYFSKKRSEIKEGRRNSKVAMNYYKVQSNTTFSESTFLDSKK